MSPLGGHGETDFPPFWWQGGRSGCGGGGGWRVEGIVLG